MSDNKNGQNDESGASEPIITFEIFETYHAENPNLDNVEYYKAFPTVNTGTIRSWKSKARTSGSEPPSSQQATPADKENLWRDELIQSLENQADYQTKEIIKDLDPESKLLVLKARVELNKKHPSPNTSSIPTPVGNVKMGIEKYMKFVPGSGKIEWSIPASVILDPIKNKKLGEF